MQEDELRKHIESFYVKIRAGRDPKTGELHLQPTDFYDQMLALLANSLTGGFNFCQLNIFYLPLSDIAILSNKVIV